MRTGAGVTRILLGWLVAGSALGAVAIFGPFIGLGFNEQFMTYRLLGLSRSGLGTLALVLLGLALAPLAFVSSRRALQWLVRKAPEVRIIRWILRDVLPAVAITLATLAAITGAAEIYFRWSVPFITGEWPMQFDSAVGVTFKPGARVRHTNHVDYWVDAKVNALGFLDREPPRSKSEGTCRIAILGDSFVEAAQVPINQKVQIRLEQLLKERLPAKRFDAMAFGYSGTGQLNQLPFYDSFARPLRPDILVLVAIANDMANNVAALESVRNGWHPNHNPRLFARRNGTSGKFELVPIDPEWASKVLPPDAELLAQTTLQRGNQALRSISYFYNWLFMNVSIQFPDVARLVAGPGADRVYAANMRKVEGLPGYAGVFDGWRYPQDLDFDSMFFAQDMPPIFKEAEALSGFALDEYLRRGARDGFKVVMLTSSSLSLRFEDKVQFGRSMVDRGYQKRFADLAKAHGVPVIDQYDHLIARGGKPEQAHFSRDGHWSAQGHLWAAEALADYIQANPAICARP